MFPDILRSFPVLSVLQHDPPAAMKAFCDLSQSIIWRLFWHFFSKKELNYIVGSSRDDRAGRTCKVARRIGSFVGTRGGLHGRIVWLTSDIMAQLRLPP